MKFLKMIVLNGRLNN